MRFLPNLTQPTLQRANLATPALAVIVRPFCASYFWLCQTSCPPPRHKFVAMGEARMTKGQGRLRGFSAQVWACRTQLPPGPPLHCVWSEHAIPHLGGSCPQARISCGEPNFFVMGVRPFVQFWRQNVAVT